MTTGNYIRIASSLRTPREEYVDAGTHAAGFVLSSIGGFVLIRIAMQRGDIFCIAGCTIYAISMMATFLASTLSHIYLPDQVNKFFRKLDQAFIYLMIVGTFSPFALTFMRTPLWLVFYSVAVVVSVCGFVSKLTYEHRVDGISVWLYIVLGITQGFAMLSLVFMIPTLASIYIVAGGLCYLSGTYFLISDIRRYRFHTIWHILVLAGCAFHYFAIFHSLQA